MRREANVCVSASSNRTESWDQRRSKVRWSSASLHCIYTTVELKTLTCVSLRACFHQSSVRRLWSLTGTRKATSVTKTWGSAWGPWDTCQQRWSSSSWASRSVSGTTAWTPERVKTQQNRMSHGNYICIFSLNVKMFISYAEFFIYMWKKEFTSKCDIL